MRDETQEEAIDLQGHLRAAGGRIYDIDIDLGTTVVGNVSLGFPAPENGYERLIGNNPGDETNSRSTDGIYLEEPEYDVDLPGGRITGTASQQSTPLLPSAELPKACQDAVTSIAGFGSLRINAGEHVDMRDGFVAPHDSLVHDMTSGSDGQVLLCVTDVDIASGAKLTVYRPTLLYVVGAQTGARSAYIFDNEGTIRTTSALGSRTDRGLTVIGARTLPVFQSGSFAYYGSLYLGDFEGSVYAPTMDVEIGPSEVEYYGRECDTCEYTTYPKPLTRHVGFLVADRTYVYGVDVDFGVRKRGDGNYYLHNQRLDDPMSVTSTLVSWSAQPMNATSSPESWTNSWWANAMGTSAQHGTMQSASASGASSGSGASSSTDGTSSSTPSSGSDASFSPRPSGGGGRGATVICTELHRQGFISDAWFAADIAYGSQRIDPTTHAIYRSWATPVAKRMQHSALVTQLAKPFAMAWAQHMAYLMGMDRYDNLLGRVLMEVGLPLHRMIGQYLTAFGWVAPPDEIGMNAELEPNEIAGENHAQGEGDEE